MVNRKMQTHSERGRRKAQGCFDQQTEELLRHMADKGVGKVMLLEGEGSS